MTTVQDLKALGEELGLAGTELREFIREQQDREHEERKTQREHEKQLREVEKDIEERQLNMKKLELEIKRIELNPAVEGESDEYENEDEAIRPEETEATAESETGNKLRVKGPKIPPFEESRDAIDAYLHRFEIYAKAQKWKPSDWAVYLSALLKGRALEVYARLPEAEITDYDKLKQALLKRFNLTEEGFRVRFRSSKPEGGETPLQYITRMESYLIRWLELAKMDKTYEGLKTLMLREQYINVCHKDLAMFLKERGPVDIPELARLAEQYLDAHKSISHSRPSQEESKSGPYIAKDIVPTNQKGPASQKLIQKCYNCGRMGHIARNCFRKVPTAAMRETTAFTEQPRAPGHRPFQWQRYGPSMRSVHQSRIPSPRREAVNTATETEPKQIMDHGNLTVC